MKKLLSIIVVSLLLSGSANATMKGIYGVYLLIESLSKHAENCSLTQQRIETAVKYILQNSKIKITEEAHAPLLYIKAVVIKAGDVCTAHTRISLETTLAVDPYKLENSGRFVFYSDERITSGGESSTFGDYTIGYIEEMMKELVVKHHEDNW